MQETCPVCSQILEGTVKVRLGTARLVQCIHCESWAYLPRNTPSKQDSIHDTETYAEHPYFQLRRSTAITDCRCRKVFSRISRALDLKSLAGERVLDVGCDTGTFITSAANQFGIIPVGIDVSKRSVALSQAIGVEAYQTRLEQAPAHLSNFSLITAVDLVEHVADPGTFLQAVQHRLRPGGHFYLETPNIDSMVYGLGAVLCRLTKGWPQDTFERLFPPQHVQYFNLNSLHKLVRRYGLEPVRMGLRVLPFRDLSTSLPIRLGLMAIQGLDVLLRRSILIYAVLRKGGGI